MTTDSSTGMKDAGQFIGVSFLGSLGILVYVIGLPFFIRMFGGREWLEQYLPSGQSLEEFLFFALFATMPAIILVPLFLLRRLLPTTFWLSFFITTGLLVFIHSSNDLSKDAQSALSLLFFPYIVAGMTLMVAVPSGIIEAIVRLKRHYSKPVSPERDHPK